MTGTWGLFRSMAPVTTYSSRGRTILVFVKPGGGQPVERYSIGRDDDKLYTVVPTTNDGQWQGLRTLVEQKEPLFALGDKYAARVKTAEMLAVGWLEHKLPEELEAYRHVTQVAHLERHDQFHLIESGPKM